MADLIINKDGTIGVNSKKKKKQPELIVGSNGKITVNNVSQTGGFGSFGGTTDIAPIKKKEEKSTWFKGGAFDDGYDFGDVTKTAAGTVADAGLGLLKGVAGIGESAAKLIVGGVAQVSDLAGNDKYADKLRNRLAGKDEKFNERQKNFTVGGILTKGQNKVDKASVLGNKSDAISEGVGYYGGMLAAQAVGIPWQVTAGVSSMGNELPNAYANNATDSQAWFSAANSAAWEIASEYLSGGLKLPGTGKTTEVLTGGLLDKMKNKTLKGIAGLGINMAGEGAEEVISGIGSALGQKLSYMKDKDFKELYNSEQALDDFIAGALVSGITMGASPSTYRNIKEGRNLITGYTSNEQSIINKEVENRINEKEQNGTKLTNKEKTKIENEVKSDLEKGYISTDLIESTIGGETYQNYKNTQDKVNSIQKEIKELESKKMSDMNVGEWNTTTERLNSLREELKSIDTNTLKTNLDAEMGNKIKSDYLLQRSYQEKNNKSVQYEADLTKYDNKQQETIKKAMDSGILNNTNKTHEFVDMIAKLSADKGVSFDFTNNQKLKDSGFAVNGKQVNGYVNQNGITVNIESNNALNSVVGHEITHVLEGTELYTELQQAVKEYATTKGVYDTKLAELTEMYKNVEGANVENELTSDLVGEYLFTDTDFVNNLSVQKPNVFKKIYNEIKYMLKVATAGSKEARQLEKVKKTFEEAYRNSGTKLTNDTKYSIQGLENYTKDEIKSISNDYIQQKLEENGLYDVEIKGIDIHGSRNRGTAKTNSDLDVVVEFDGDVREDTLFDILNDVEDQLEIDGIKVDINPITATDTGTLEDYMKRSNEYDKEVLAKGTKYSISDKGTLQDSNGNDVSLETSSVGTHNDLMAIHNLTEEKFNGILDLGGLPGPSIAITNEATRAGNKNFGEYALLFSKDTIDPSNNKNKVYSRDAYTARFPEITYKLNDTGIKELAKILGESPSSIESNFEGKTPSQAADKLRRNDTILNKFLNENNLKVEDVYKDVGFNYTFSTDENVKNFVKENDITFDKLLNNKELRNKFYELYRETTSETLRNFTERKIETFEKAFNENNINIGSRLDSDFNAIKNGAAKEMDTMATRKEKLKVAEENGYKKYLDDLVAPAFGDKFIRNDVDEFTSNGRRSFNKLYDAFNLENLTKAIIRKGDSGQESSFNHGINEMAGNASIRFNSIEDIKNNKNLLQSVDEAQYKNKIMDIEYRLSGIQDNIIDRGHNNSDNSFIAYDNLISTISDSARDFGNGKNVTAESIKNDLKNVGFNVTTEEAQQILDIFKEMRSLPTEYFEAKPQRAIKFDEVQTAVIPNNASEEIKQKITDKGMNFVEYDPNIDGDYEAKINQFDDLKFSLSNQDVAPTKQSGNIYGEDVRLQEEIAPMQESIEELTQKVNDIADKMDKQLLGTPVTETELPYLEQQYANDFKNTDYDNIPYFEGSINDLSQEVEIKNKKDIVDEIRSNFNIKTKEAQDLYNTIAKQQDITVEDVARELDNYSDFKSEYLPESDKEIRKYIRNTKINMSNLKNQITDYNAFRKANFGKLRLTNDGAGIDTVYQELSSMYPGEFDSSIVNEADQLQALADYMNSDNKIIEEYSMDYDTVYKLASDIYADIKNKIKFKDNSKLQRELVKNMRNMEVPAEYASNRIDINNIEPMGSEDIAPTYKDPTKESTYNEIAEILETEPKKVDTRNKRKWAIFKAAVLDKGSVFEDLSLKAKNRELMSKWDYTLTSQARAQTVIGEGHYVFDSDTQTQRQTSKSLNAIREEVDNTGLTKEFSEYIYHKHNVDRMNLETKAKEKMINLEGKLKEVTSEEDIKAIQSEIKALEKVKNKPVFGDSVTSQVSQNIVDNYERSHPEFINYANDVYEYLKADRQELVREGVISQDTANLWQEMYPHYVPVRRVDSNGIDINVPLDTGRTGINAPIKKATGGNTDILPLFDTMAMRTLQTYRATAKNSFGLELMNTLNTPTISEYADVDTLIDSVDNQDSLLQEGKNGNNPTFTVFEHGEKITYEITKDMYDALKPVSDSSFLSKTIKPLNVASNIHRGVLTQYNLFFALTNAVKDAQDVLMNSQHAAKTYATIPEAWAQQIKKGYWYQEYLAHGGEQNSYFDSHDNTFMPEKKGIAKLTETFPLKSIATINDFIEMTPRLAEYIASRKAGASIETAMLDSARVTTNFKAGGDFTKFLNRNGATFLNASVQGFNQQIRNIREANAKGLRGWANLATKFAAAGLPALLLNALLWDDDDDYEELSDYVKQNYYVVAKYGDGQFIRIPKGRTLAVIQNAMEQMQDVVTGDDKADLGEFISMVLNNLAPNNPIENNILSPIIQVATNKAWYGGDLVPTRLQDMPAAEQYDESTDSFSKWLGEKLNISPYKVNYVLNQYTGFLGDMFLPMATPEAKNDSDSVGDYLIAPLKDKFTADSVMNNKNTGELFETSEKLTTNAKKSNATDEDTLKNKFVNAMRSEMNDLYKQKREIQNSDLSKSEKYNQVREIQKEINALAKSALNNYEDVKVNENYASVSDIEYYKHLDSEGKEVWAKINSEEKEALNGMNMSDSDKNNYFAAKNTISGIVKEYKNNKATLDDEDEDSYKEAASTLSGEKKTTIINTIKNSGLNDEQKAYLYDKYYASTDKLDVVVKTGISMDSYLDLEAQNFQSDKDYKGDTISGSKKRKVFDYINSTDLDFEQRLILAKMYYPSYDEYNYDIIDYLNNNDYLDYDSEVKILKTLGFKVSDDGTITWK